MRTYFIKVKDKEGKEKDRLVMDAEDVLILCEEEILGSTSNYDLLTASIRIKTEVQNSIIRSLEKKEEQLKHGNKA